jgi:hypothetical protein
MTYMGPEMFRRDQIYIADSASRQLLDAFHHLTRLGCLSQMFTGALVVLAEEAAG